MYTPDTVLIHAGINDVLNNKSQSNTENLLSNIKYMVDKCRKFGVKNILISGLVFTTRVSLEVLEKIHEKLHAFCSSYGLTYIDNRNIRGVHLYQDNPHLLQSGKKILFNNFISYLNSNFLIVTSFTNVDINQSILNETYQKPIHSLTKTDSSTMDLSISSCDLSKEHEVLNLVNQASNKSINVTSPNLLFEIKKLRIRNPNKIIIGNLNINSLPNKFEQLKDIVMQHIDILVLIETKLDDKFPTAQFLVNGFSEPYRLDRNRKGEGLWFTFVKIFQVNC